MLTIILFIILLAGKFRLYFTEIVTTTLTTNDIKKKLNTTLHLTWLSNEDNDSTDVMYREDLFEGDIVFINNGTIISNRVSTIQDASCCKSWNNFSVPRFKMLVIQHNAVRQKALLWPHGRIPYIISNAYTNISKLIILEAFKEYQLLTCIRFVPKKQFDFNYIYIAPYDGCYSMIGNNGGKQEVSLGDGCLKKGIVIHELMHVLGFFHEQNRPDRDLYVDILWENVKPTLLEQFDKYEATIIDDLGSPYDYDSVMHYSAVAFSKNGKPTIIPKSIDKVIKIGQRHGLSSIDVWKINKLYNCMKKISVNPASNVQNMENGEQSKELQTQVSGTIRKQFATTIRTVTAASTLSNHSTVTIANISNNNNNRTRTRSIQEFKVNLNLSTSPLTFMSTYLNSSSNLIGTISAAALTTMIATLPTTSSSPALQRILFCNDRHRYCQILKTLIKDFCIIYPRFVQDYCAHSCEKCKKKIT
ncbi:Zinc metalloproteinase nas-13 [Dirofilaria immitis]